MVAEGLSGAVSDASVPPLDDLLASARRLSISESGELFDATHLLELGRLHAPHVEWTAIEWTNADQCTSVLDQGGVVLVAYDKDGNNEPCLKNGSKAHWAVVNGYAHPGKGAEDAIIRRFETTSSPALITAAFEELPSRNLASTPPSNLYLLCYHGKSLHQAVWAYEDLFRSNANLYQVADDIMRSDKHIVPGQGQLDGLRGWIIVAQ